MQQNPGQYEVILLRRARKFFKLHPDIDQWDEIKEELSQRPMMGARITHMKPPLYCSRRWREGSYRLLYDVEENEKKVFVFDAGYLGGIY